MQFSQWVINLQVIVGLGNPGKKYDRNRHNVGFKAIDLIAKKNNFGPWRGKFQSKISEGLIKSKKILLVKPETYMNNSGFAIKELFLFFKLNSDDLVVVHDDLDLKVGKIKVKVGGGHGGHNGLRSIDQQISKEYLRLRIGIDRPVNKSQVANYVLSNFSEKDKYTIDNVINLITQDFEILANKDIKKFINSINQKLGKVAIKSESTNNKLQAKVLPSFKDLLNSIIK